MYSTATQCTVLQNPATQSGATSVHVSACSTLHCTAKHAGATGHQISATHSSESLDY